MSESASVDSELLARPLVVKPDDVAELEVLYLGLLASNHQLHSPAVFEIAQRLRMILNRVTGITR